jgi:hypothetical protein
VNTTTIIVITVVVLALVAIVGSRSGGPRVTTIERRTHRETEEDEQ